MVGSIYINGVEQSENNGFAIPTDESVGGMLFDTSGFSNPFETYPLLYNNFQNGKVQCIHNMDEAELLGITDNGFMNGILYYHVFQFFKYIGANQALYICIADCSAKWEVIQDMQLQTTGKLFQIGVWTTQPIWKLKSDKTLGFTSLITDLQVEANEICGKIGTSGPQNTPLSIILCGNSNYVNDDYVINYKKLPNAYELDCPKVSVVLAQSGTDEVHTMQSHNPLCAPVGALGFVMACLALCGAEASIACPLNFDLNKDEQFPEPELGFCKDYTPLLTLSTVWIKWLANYGYIIPLTYDGMDGQYFFSSDNTLSEGDYRSIANNRIMHKCRRAVYTVLLPYINSNHIFDYQTNNINVTSQTIITDSINTILDSVMRNKNGERQIVNRTVEFGERNQYMLENDSISVTLKVQPINGIGSLVEEMNT